ncbi:TetR family transcriptional regulator [Paraburkholderia caffeinilytica]|jgi:AcrR family transcriptional regulator|uniref:TetR family transcriptional regulator n=1 Tax=Paraburkholderia caffeinilytica TaxID=1761016 RepID=A0ABQ1LDL3_9BURK|nr:TetR/AcrR family transcriptional regulator [Paraburkholderia caffeinilytica]AXL51271.1 TetR family transcriptional regulator [Paraburkholderia caffeinilytica]GGC23106.1 TetR family transcriptional regulator [Paraburkholderia caffeinilytica]CAB3777233.1 HTH-type transcriptional regulator BetI [Paraburkholderia caffeinilytica]
MRKKTEEKRQAIVDAAFEVFSEVGFEQASMSEIAAQAGASKATLYGYFKSKEEMFFEVMIESAAQEVIEAFALLKTSVPIREALTGFGKHYLTAILKPQLLAVRRLTIHEGGRSHVGALFYERGPKIGWQMVMNFLQQSSEAGQLCKCNVTVATAHLQALYEAELVELCLLGVPANVSARNITQVVNRAVDVFMAAYGGDSDKSR